MNKIFSHCCPSNFFLIVILLNTEMIQYSILGKLHIVSGMALDYFYLNLDLGMVFRLFQCPPFLGACCAAASFNYNLEYLYLFSGHT